MPHERIRAAAGRAIAKFGISITFQLTGNLGAKATEKAIGRGLDVGTNTLINGVNMTLEKTIGVGTEKMLIK